MSFPTIALNGHLQGSADTGRSSRKLSLPVLWAVPTGPPINFNNAAAAKLRVPVLCVAKRRWPYGIGQDSLLAAQSGSVS